MIPINYEPKISTDEERLYLVDEMPTSFLEAFGANFSLQTDYNPTWGMYREAQRQKAGEDDNEIIPLGVLNEQYANLGLFFKKDEPRGYVNLLVEQKKNELKRQSIVARGPQNIFAKSSYFLSGLPAAVLDPINIGASFVPVVGQSRFLNMVSRYGVNKARFVKGIQEGFVGNVAVEPLSFMSANQEQRDYTVSNAMMNVVFGSLAGGGLHVTFGKVGDLYKKYTGKENIYTEIANAPPEFRQDLVKYTIGQLMQDKKPNVAAFLEMTKIARKTDLEANINLSKEPITANKLFEERKLVVNNLRNELNNENQIIKKELEVLKEQNKKIYENARKQNDKDRRNLEKQIKKEKPDLRPEEVSAQARTILAERTNKKLEPIIKRIKELEGKEKIIVENTINEQKLIQNLFQLTNPINKKIFVLRSKLQNLNEKINNLKLKDGRALLEKTSLQDEASVNTIVATERVRTKFNPTEGEDLDIIPIDNNIKMNPENIKELNDNITSYTDQTQVLEQRLLEKSPFLQDYIKIINQEINNLDKPLTREADLNKSIQAGVSCLVKKGIR